MTDRSYLVWSHEHGAWWAGIGGYTRQFSKAARFTLPEAMRICVRSIPGTAEQIGALPELPVLADHVAMMRDMFAAQYPNATMSWE